MAGLTQRQQSNNHFTLESILEEEDNEQEAIAEKIVPRKEIHKNSEANKSLPFDKCIEADNEVDELEQKKMLCKQLGDKSTTKKESKREIRKWLGIGTIIKTILKVTFKPIIAFVISIAGVIAFAKFSMYSLNMRNYFLGATLIFGSIVMIIMLVATAIGALAWIAMDDYNFIEEKMRDKKYMIDENIIDCPIAVKEELLSCIKDDDELYIRLNKKKNRIDALDEKSNFSSSWKFEKPKGKHDIEYQMKYFADQLEDGKIYKISDIITDKAYKN